MEEGNWILIIGSPVGGFRYVGPFRYHDHALEYAELAGEDSEWWITQLDQP